MEESKLSNISKSKKNIVNLYELRELEHDIQKGKEMLLENFGSQENVTAHLREVKNELYQKLF